LQSRNKLAVVLKIAKCVTTLLDQSKCTNSITLHLTSLSKTHLICQNTAMTSSETTDQPIDSFQLIRPKLDLWSNERT